MKKILLTGLLLCLTASMAMAAAGLNFYWTGATGECPATGAGLSAATWDCTLAHDYDNDVTGANEGYFTAVASFFPGTLFASLKGIEVVMDGQSAGDLPAWWQGFNLGACRATAYGSFAKVSPVAAPCLVLWTATPQGGIGAFQTTAYPPGTPFPDPLPNRFRIKIGFATAAARTTLLNTTKQYNAFSLTMNTTKSLDDPLADPPVVACAGCDMGVTIVLNQITLKADAGKEDITLPASNRCITWQGGGGLTACDATPARNTTWGNVKSLYR